MFLPHKILSAVRSGFLAAAAALGLWASAAHAASVTLAWNPVNGVAGYRLYYGGQSGEYTNTVESGLQTSVVVEDLIDGATYYFAVTDYDWLGVGSAFSNEVVYRVAPAAPVLQANEVLVRAPVIFQASSNLYEWFTAAKGCAWLVRPSTNLAEFYRALILPLNIEREP